MNDIVSTLISKMEDFILPSNDDLRNADKNLQSIDLQEKEFICAGMIKNSTNDEVRELYDLILSCSVDS